MRLLTLFNAEEQFGQTIWLVQPRLINEISHRYTLIINKLTLDRTFSTISIWSPKTFRHFTHFLLKNCFHSHQSNAICLCFFFHFCLSLDFYFYQFSIEILENWSKIEEMKWMEKNKKRKTFQTKANNVIGFKRELGMVNAKCECDYDC